MKKMRCILCLAVLACFMFSGCKPIYQQFIQGAWKVDTYYYDGKDQTSTFLLAQKDYRITFHSDGDYTETYTVIILPMTVSGTWEIERKQDGKLGEFQMKLSDNSQVRTFVIKKISKDTIDIYRDRGDGHNEEFILEPVPAS